MTFREQINKLQQNHPNLIIVAVTKTQPLEKILELPKEITNIAENKVQEAKIKFQQFSDTENKRFIKHFIGRIQSNKINKIIKLFDIIQSIDSLTIAEKISNHASKQNKEIKIMLQINIDSDPNKQGFKGDLKELIEICEKIKKLPNLKLIGLMTILENTQDVFATENSFRNMQNLFNQLNKHIIDLKFLSMGMSDDYEIALKNGSNMIRIGKKLF